MLEMSEEEIFFPLWNALVWFPSIEIISVFCIWRGGSAVRAQRHVRLQATGFSRENGANLYKTQKKTQRDKGGKHPGHKVRDVLFQLNVNHSPTHNKEAQFAL